MRKWKEFDLFIDPSKGREGGIKLLTIKVSSIISIEDMGLEDACLITLKNGNEFFVNIPYFDLKETITGVR